MSRSKYIIFEQRGNKSPCPVIFSASYNHNEIADLFLNGMDMDIKSAGVVDFSADDRFEVFPSCIPGSVTLGIPMDLDKAKEDAETLSICLMKQ